jgi:hypothetical protein
MAASIQWYTVKTTNLVSTANESFSGNSSFVPPNWFVKIRMVKSGDPPCVSNGNCSMAILADSPEFITFNNGSRVTALPNNGIQTAVPTPSNMTVTTTITMTQSHTEIATATESSDSTANRKIEIAAGVAGGVGGLLLGILAAASVLYFRRSKPVEPSPSNSPQIARPINTRRVPNTMTQSPATQWFASWGGQTRYEPSYAPVMPEQSGGHIGSRGVATLDFQRNE